MNSLLLFIEIIVVVALATIPFGQTSTSSGTAAQIVERNIFASDIYAAVAGDNIDNNVVISPAAIQTSMALAYGGAKGKTATEMQTGLRLGSGNPEDITRRFAQFQLSFSKDNNIRLVNNIYINENLEFKGKFRDQAQRDFESNVEKADFHPPYNKRTADRINTAMKDKTNGKITDIINAKQMDDLTEGIIVNGITYSAPWQKAFKAEKTAKKNFLTAQRQTVQVDTMWTLNNFQYGEVATLNAKVIELPYQNADFSMILLLPNQEDGLKDLIKKVNGKNLLALLDNSLSTTKVEVSLPKFSVTFGTNLVEPFKKLGVTTMFTRSGDFGNLYRMFVSHYINSANHKAFVAITEDGAEPSIEVGALKSLFSRNKKFEAKHPFLFAIKHKDSILFMGHISNYAYL